MVDELITGTTLIEDLRLVPNTVSGGSLLPVTPAPRNLTLSSSLCGYLHSCVHTAMQAHTCT